jgi:hypothetical protein
MQNTTMLTQLEKAFIVQYLADEVASLTAINCDCLKDSEYFLRVTDVLEVLQNLQMLYNTADEDADEAQFAFTIEEAGTALCAYDTEYRESICERFADACDEASFTTLAQRVFNAY